MLRILALFFTLTAITASEPMLRLNAIPRELHGLYVVTHQAEYRRDQDVPLIRRLDQVPASTVQYQLEVDSFSVTLAGTRYPAHTVIRQGHVVMWESGNETVAFGASLIPGYNIMFVFGPTSKMVLMCRR